MDVTKTLKDAAYISIGFGVIAFQKAQVRRQELRKNFEQQVGQLEAQLTEVRTQVEKLAKDVEERVQPLVGQVEAQVEEALDKVEARLPEQARTYFEQARAAAKELRTEVEGQVRKLGATRTKAA